MTLLLLAALAAAAAPAGPPPAPAACFWSYPRNLPLPEANARYWRGDFRLARGERLELRGRFPHARQMSFNLHRASDNAALGSASDVELVPARGSANPYRPGARRDARQRDYRVAVDPWAPPGRAGTIGASLADDRPFEGRLLYRMYLPDRAAPGGGVALPELWKVAPDGTRARLGGACPDPAAVATAQTIGPTRLPPAPGEVSDPIDWRGSATPAGSGSGDLLVNRDNAYAYALTDYRRGDVLVLTGRAPTHPRTLDGQTRMGTGQVRYWSICAYRHPSDRSAACLADEAIPLDADRRFTVVVAPADKRPANARAECGVAWLDALTDAEGALLLRHVAPNPGFANTPLRVTAQEGAGAALGPYEPVGRYASRAAFEARGCRR